MKTLDELVERTDYKIVNGQMRKRCVKLAEKLLKACQLVGLDEVDTFELAGMEFEIQTLKPRCGYTEDIIYLSYNRQWYAINREQSYYFCNDYNFHVEAAPSRVFLEFLNNAKAVFEDLEQKQDELIEKMRDSLAKTEEL